MVRLSHFNVEVLQNDVAAKEYSDPLVEDSLDVETKYIEVREGESFIMRLTVDKDFKLERSDGLSVEVVIDGEYAGGICYQHLIEGHENVWLIESLSHIRNGKSTLRKFRFEEAEMSMGLWSVT